MKIIDNSELAEKVKDLYLNQNLSCTKIGKLIGTTATTVSAFLKRNGVEVVNKQNLVKFDLDKDIIPKVRQGISLTKLAKEYHTNRQTLSSLLKKRGIEVINHLNATKFNETVFDCVDTEEKAYWLGFIFADGCIATSNYKFELSLQGSDIDHLSKFNKFMLHNKDNVKLGQVTLNGKTFTRCRWSVSNQHLWNSLNSLGCTPKKSLILQFPDLSIFSSLELVRHFIRGYFDGDGCLSYYKDSLKPAISLLGTCEFLEEVQSILKDNGIKSSIHLDPRMENTLVMLISMPTSMLFLDYLYNSCSIYLDRKYERYNIFKNCRSKQECLELLLGKIGEDCNVNTEVTTEIKESVAP